MRSFSQVDFYDDLQDCVDEGLHGLDVHGAGDVRVQRLVRPLFPPELLFDKRDAFLTRLGT